MLLILGLVGIVILVMMLGVPESARRDRMDGRSRAPPLSAVLAEFARRRATLGPLYLAMAVSTVSD